MAFQNLQGSLDMKIDDEIEASTQWGPALEPSPLSTHCLSSSCRIWMSEKIK